MSPSNIINTIIDSIHYVPLIKMRYQNLSKRIFFSVYTITRKVITN